MPHLDDRSRHDRGLLRTVSVMAPTLQADLARRPGGGEFVNVVGAAAMLRVSPSYLNKRRVYGDGPPFHKFGKAVRYEVAGLLDWAAAQARRSTSEATS